MHFIHLDQIIASAIQNYGTESYLIMFLILFAQTGIVITPFMPGDSLLLVAGIFATPEKHALSLPILIPVLLSAPILGNLVNYHVGKWFGHRFFTHESSKWLNPKHLRKTHSFFERYGAKTVLVGSWVPIVRTFAPFIAGVSEMDFTQFASYSVIGSSAWVLGCLVLGYFFGNLPFVKNNFELTVLGFMIILATPLGVEIYREWHQSQREKKQESTASEP